MLLLYSVHEFRATFLDEMLKIFVFHRSRCGVRRICDELLCWLANPYFGSPRRHEGTKEVAF